VKKDIKQVPRKFNDNRRKIYQKIGVFLLV